jgi:molybdenum ABC transporter molybdate-binding protein
MKDAKAWLFGSLLAVVALVGLLVLGRPGRPSNGVSTEPLVVFCAAGLKPPVESAAAAYGRESGIPVQLQYGGSGTLLANIKVAEHGDLFLAADDSYLQIARSNGLLAETVPIARLTPVLAVARGNPRGVRGLADLSRVGVALANPEAAAVGNITREVLRRSGQWNDIEARVKVFKPTVNDVANDIKLGTVDAGVVWDATVRQYPELEAVEVPEFSANAQTVSIGVLKSSRQPTAALRFARYLGAPERGLKEFSSRGYRTVEGDAWAEVPEVVLFSGGVNRVAIEPTLKRFEEREGALITRVYNGCGILVSQMKSGQHPDAYFACDVSFMRQVTNLFSSALNVSRTAMVMLVPAGNPRNLRSLADLAQPGLRVGVANAEQSALGALTARLLSAQGLLDRVMANVRVQTPTADLLVAQMRSGSLDVVVVYQANTTQVGDKFAVVPLPEPDALAIQPYAVRQNSRHRFLMERLQAALVTSESRSRFESAGFQWLVPPAQTP